MRTWSFILLPGLILALGFGGCSDSTGPTDTPRASEITSSRLTDRTPCGDPLTVTLYAARTTEVGYVMVFNDDGTLTIQIQTTGRWVMDATKVALGKTLDDIPQTPSGNPKLGHFKPSTDHRPPVSSFEYVIDFPLEPGQELFLAVYASAYLSGGLSSRVRKQAAWADGLPFPGKNWATYFNYTLQPCEPTGEIFVTVPSEAVCEYLPFPITWEPFDEESFARIELLRDDDTLCRVLAESIVNTGEFQWDALNWCDDEIMADAYSVRVSDLATGASGQSIQFVIEDCGGGE